MGMTDAWHRPPEGVVQEARESVGIAHGESGRPILGRRDDRLGRIHERQRDT